MDEKSEERKAEEAFLDPEHYGCQRIERDGDGTIRFFAGADEHLVAEMEVRWAKGGRYVN